MSRHRDVVRGTARTWAVSIAAVLIASLVVGAAHADELRDAVHWNAEVCGAPFYTFAATATDPWNPGYTSHREQVKGAWAGASWMIVREGVWNKTMNFSSGCTGAWSGGSWFDNGNELSSGWYETGATVTARCAQGPAVGCTALDHVALSSDIIAADITISRDNNWGVINQDSAITYLESNLPITACQSFENTWLHELGHAYGLDHTSAQISTMGNGSFCTKNINIPQAYNDQYWPLDNAQMRPLYEIAAGSSTRRNFSVSAFRRLPLVDGDFIDQPGAVFLTTGTPTRSLTVNYSLNRYFAASTGSVRVQFRFVKDGFEPIFDWGTLSWVWPAETSTDLTDVQTSASGTVDTATTRTFTFNVTRADLPAATGTWYRLWMRVDDTSAWVETDEGDNVVPTRFYVVKS